MFNIRGTHKHSQKYNLDCIFLGSVGEENIPIVFMHQCQKLFSVRWGQGKLWLILLHASVFSLISRFTPFLCLTVMQDSQFPQRCLFLSISVIMRSWLKRIFLYFPILKHHSKDTLQFAPYIQRTIFLFLYRFEKATLDLHATQVLGMSPTTLRDCEMGPVSSLQ